MDRGLIKWGAFVMPEHANRLNRWKEEDTYEERIELLGDEIEEMNFALSEATETGAEIEIKYYVNRLKRHEKVKCTVIKYYAERHTLSVREIESLDLLNIRMMDIASVQIIGAW